MRPASRYTQREDGTIDLRLHPYYAAVTGPFWSIGMVVVVGVSSDWRFDPWYVLVLVIRNVFATYRLPWAKIRGLHLTWVPRRKGNSTYELYVTTTGGYRIRAYGAQCVSHQRFLNTAATVRRRAEAIGVPFTVPGHDDLGWQPPPESS